MKTALLVLAFIATGCSDGSIDLRYKEEVTIVHPFYGSWCCRATSKLNKSTYRFSCETDAPQEMNRSWENEVDVKITKGCAVNAKEQK